MTRPPEDLDALYRAWAPRILRYLRTLLGPGRASWADDVLQETFLKIRNGLDAFDASRPLKPWIFSIAHHEAMRLHRRESLRRTSPLPGTLESRPRCTTLTEVLETLDPDVRAAILLVHLEGFSRREAAGLMGLGERRVQALCHEGFTRLRKILKNP